MKIKVTVEIGRAGCSRETTFEVDADASDDEIDTAAQEAMFEMVNWSWAKAEDTPRAQRTAQIKSEIDKVLKTRSRQPR